MIEQALPLDFRPPRCPDYHTMTRFAGAHKEPSIPELVHRLFACDCGFKSDQLVADA